MWLLVCWFVISKSNTTVAATLLNSIPPCCLLHRCFDDPGYYGRPFEARNKVRPGTSDTPVHAQPSVAAAQVVPDILHSFCNSTAASAYAVVPGVAQAACCVLCYLQAKGGAFTGDNKEYLRFVLGAGEVIPGFDEAVVGMKPGGIRRVVVPPELGYPDNDYNKQGPKPTTFSVSVMSGGSVTAGSPDACMQLQRVWDG